MKNKKFTVIYCLFLIIIFMIYTFGPSNFQGYTFLIIILATIISLTINTIIKNRSVVESKKVLMLGLKSSTFFGMLLMICFLTYFWLPNFDLRYIMLIPILFLVLAIILFGPAFLAMSIWGILLGFKRLKQEKNKADIIGLLLSCISILIIGTMIITFILNIHRF